ncbi:MAG: T9SS type A sorting domain-containing protein, partial [Bacteroidota bacterium]|nr:T9SS type A sorting domain-containing protein [Bacteroidota bacterium]
EIKTIQSYVLGGGMLVLMGNGKSPASNDIVNSILSDFRWKTDHKAPTGLLLNSNSVVVDSKHPYSSNDVSPFFTTFIYSDHPYLKGIDTVVAFNSASIALSDSALPFLQGRSTTYALNAGAGQDSSQPVLIAVSEVGKGKIILFGGAEMFGNGQAVTGDSSTGIFAKKNLQFALNVFSYTDNYLVRMPQPTPNEEYRIISIPFDLNDFTIADVLKDLGEAGPTNWRLFGHWNDARGAYEEFPSPGFYSFKRGEGYWLITKGERTLTLGNATVTPAQGFFAIRLGPGYNLIGNPFPYTVSWQNSLRPASVEPYLWQFDGKQFLLDSMMMEPFAGYFVKNLSGDSATVYINPEQITPMHVSKMAFSQEMSSLSAGEWEVQIKAADGDAKDEQNYAGVLSSASNEWDANDFSEPPPSPGDYVMLSFNEEKWKKYPGRYAGDFHAPNSDGQYWDFDVAVSKEKDHVSLSFQEFGNIPSGFGVYLVDTRTECVAEISSSLSYDFSMEKGETDRPFRLLVGKKEFVEQNTNGIPLVPLAFSLEQNFPNPFNPTTTIHYTLGHSSHVVLEIYNVLGQQVRRLVEADQPIGTYSAEWDGKNDNGITAASGVYFYRIRTQKFSDVKRMVLIR